MMIEYNKSLRYISSINNVNYDERESYKILVQNDNQINEEDDANRNKTNCTPKIIILLILNILMWMIVIFI